MNIEEDYKELYSHWHQEYEQSDLTKLSQQTFKTYKDIVNTINEFTLEKKTSLGNELLEAYRHNFNFLFNDLLKIRKKKIVNASLSLQEIDLNLLIEAEQLLYQNLIASLKGFEKLKRYSDSSPEEKEDMKQIEVSVELKKKESTQQTQNGEQENQINKVEPIIEDAEETINYSLIRFIKDTSAIVGIDLINYGPFEKEDIAYLPEKNALILVNEKFATFFNIT
jgi:DNA replication initiation complex subunit (GINS family)